MKTRDITELGLLLSIGFVLSYLESQIPVIIAVPGMKIGLANIATMFVLYRQGSLKAFFFMHLRVLLTGFLFAGASTIIFSLCGGILCIVVMTILKRFDFISILGVSMAGAIGHNMGQIIIACIISQNIRILYYFPVLCLSAVVSGLFIGYISFHFLKLYNKMVTKNHE
ncbi:MAG: Gx transporter family protein [Lachnospiraceae bacterium]